MPYRFVDGLYLEHFGEETLLLVADRDRLLTVNAAAAELFSSAVHHFGRDGFTRCQASAWLADAYELDAVACDAKACTLLAFALRQGLVEQVTADRTRL